MGLDRVAGGAGDLGDERPFAPEQRIEERGFAGVGPAGKDHERALPEPFDRRRGGHELADLGRRPHSIWSAIRRGGDGAVVFFREVDVVAEQCLHLDEGLAQRGQAAGEPTFQLVERCLSLGWGRRVDRDRLRLGLYQIELAVQHRTAGEFTRSGRPSSGGVKCRQQPAWHRQAAVAGKLHEVLAGVTVRAGECGVETTIDRAALRIAEGGEGGAPGRLRLETG